MDLATLKVTRHLSLGTGVVHVSVLHHTVAATTPAQGFFHLLTLPGLKPKLRHKLGFTAYSVELLDRHGTAMLADLAAGRVVKIDPTGPKVTRSVPVPWPAALSRTAGYGVVSTMGKPALMILDLSKWLVADVRRLPRMSGAVATAKGHAAVVYGRKREPGAARLYHLSTGLLLWETRLPPRPRGVGFAGDHLFASLHGGRLVVLARANGRILQQIKLSHSLGALWASRNLAVVLQPVAGWLVVLKRVTGPPTPPGQR